MSSIKTKFFDIRINKNFALMFRLYILSKLSIFSVEPSHYISAFSRFFKKCLDGVVGTREKLWPSLLICPPEYSPDLRRIPHRRKNGCTGGYKFQTQHRKKSFWITTERFLNMPICQKNIKDGSFLPVHKRS